jgi:hypothetical protein
MVRAEREAAHLLFLLIGVQGKKRDDSVAVVARPGIAQVHDQSQIPADNGGVGIIDK